MNASSVDIADMLEAEVILGLTHAFNLHIGKEPAKPDNCITVFDTPGYPPALGLKEQGYEYPSVQIRVRNRKYMEGWQTIQDIMSLLHGKSQQEASGTLYSVIYCSSGPALLDWDDNGNVRFIINFNLQRRAV
jgi:hypothetical protein